MPIGEDAASVTFAMAEKMLSGIIELLKLLISNKMNSEKNMTFVGEMSKKDKEKFLKAGGKFDLITVPKDKADDICEKAQELGGSFFRYQTEGNTVTLAVASNAINQVQQAVEITIKEQLTKEPDTLVVKDGENIVKAENMDTLSQVLDYYDIPVYSFEDNNGNYKVFVPAEYEQQYEKAVAQTAEIQNSLKDFQMVTMDKSIDLQSVDYGILENISASDIPYLSAEFPDGEFIKGDDDKIYMKYSLSDENKIAEYMDELKEDSVIADEYIVDVVDSTITVNKDALLVPDKETASEYFARVPNTQGEWYIKMPKEQCKDMDNGQTLSLKLDYTKHYEIYDKDGINKSTVAGTELGAKYNTRSRHANKDTEVNRYNLKSQLERIEVFSKAKNKLITLDITDAKSTKNTLIESGFTSRSADKLISEINKKMPDEYKETFAYTAPKFDLSEKDIKPLLENARMGEIYRKSEHDNDIKKANCCIYDKNTNKAIFMQNTSSLSDRIKALRDDTLLAKVIAHTVQKSYDKEGTKLERESVQAETFDTKNIDVANLKYSKSDEHKYITILNENTNDDTVKFAQISYEASRSAIEKSLAGLGLNSIAVAETMICMEKASLTLDAAKPINTRNGFEIAKITSDCYTIAKNDLTITVDKNNLSADKISTALHIDKSEAEKFIKSFEKSAERAEHSGVGDKFKQTFSDLKRSVQEFRDSNKTTSKETLEKTSTERSL